MLVNMKSAHLLIELILFKSALINHPNSLVSDTYVMNVSIISVRYNIYIK